MVKHTRLDCGATVVSDYIPQFRSCSLGLWVQCGSRCETAREAGLSHFLEHMLFKGTARRSAVQIAREMDAVGGQLNAFTEKEHTCYYASVVDRHLPKALDVLSDMFFNSSLDSGEMEKEKGVILEEINMYQDSPEDVVFDMFSGDSWPGHPLGRPVLGDAEVVASVDRQGLLAYMRRHYCPQRFLLAAAGQLEHERLVEACNDWFASWSGEAGEQDLVPGGAADFKPGLTVKYRDCEQVNLCWGVPGLAVADERRYALLVADSVLGASMSCRLFQEIREKRGLAYSVGTFQNAYRDCGTYGVYAGTSPEHAQQVLDLSRQVMADFRREGLSQEEIAMAKEHIKGSLALGLESTSNRMVRLARCFSYHGRYISEEEFCDSVDSVKSEDIQRLAEQMLNPQEFRIDILGPIKSIDGVEAQPEE